jgi:acetylglutamate kinase
MFFSDIALSVGSTSMLPTVPGSFSEAFATSVARIVKFRGQTVVVKLGGSAMEDPAATFGCLQSVATLNHLGIRVVLVHGGGKPIDRAMAEAGLTPKKVAGRRYTDEETLAIVVRVLKDVINVGIAGQLRELGASSSSISDALFGNRLQLPGSDNHPIDLGRVGKVTQVDTATLTGLIEKGVVPVIPSLALADEGGWLNVNADTAASAVAGGLKATKAIFLTDTPGVLRARHDPETLIPKLTVSECRDLISSGIIDGGMVPKVEACFEALDAGAHAALILDGRVAFSLLDVFLHDTFSGTEITR